MLAITPLNNISSTNYIKQTVRQQALPKLGNDSVTFTGSYTKHLTNSKEVKELARIFVDSLIDNAGLSPEKLGFFDRIARYFSINAYTIMAKFNINITEAVKDGDKILGGYAINIAHKTKSAHIGFMTLAKENKNTRVGVETLKTIARRIYDNAVANNVEKITWSTSNVNKPMNRMLSRFDAQVVRKIGGETEYAISTEDFGKVLEKLGA